MQDSADQPSTVSSQQWLCVASIAVPQAIVVILWRQARSKKFPAPDLFLTVARYEVQWQALNFKEE